MLSPVKTTTYIHVHMHINLALTVVTAALKFFLHLSLSILRVHASYQIGSRSPADIHSMLRALFLECPV